MPRGARPGERRGGRQKGTKNKATIERERFARHVAEQAAASGEAPLDYMLRVMRTSNDAKRRDTMAIAAAPYVHARLSAVEHSGETVRHIISDQPEMTPDAWKRKHCSEDPPTAH